MVKVPVEVSARHLHLSKTDLEKLFGEGSELYKFKQLSQPSDFASEEIVDIRVGENTIKNVRVVGPLRTQTQVEISITDSFILGVKPPIRLSGDLKGTSGVTILGPAGVVDLSEGLIVASHHLHCGTAEADELGLKNGDKVAIQIDGDRSVVFKDIPVRVKDDYKLCLHLDTDEGNAVGINKIGEGEIIL
jgi:putative phosphotransacetylase